MGGALNLLILCNSYGGTVTFITEKQPNQVNSDDTKKRVHSPQTTRGNEKHWLKYVDKSKDTNQTRNEVVVKIFHFYQSDNLGIFVFLHKSLFPPLNYCRNIV